MAPPPDSVTPLSFSRLAEAGIVLAANRDVAHVLDGSAASRRDGVMPAGPLEPRAATRAGARSERSAAMVAARAQPCPYEVLASSTCALRWRGSGQSNLPLPLRGPTGRGKESPSMSTEVLRRSRRVRLAGRGARQARHHRSIFQSRRACCPTFSPVTTCSCVRRRGRARRSRSRCRRCGSRMPAEPGRLRCSSSPPTRELASQIVAETQPLASSQEPDRHRRVRPRRARAAGADRRTVAHPRRHPRPAARPDRPRRRLSLGRVASCSCSTRPTACSTWDFAPWWSGSSR